MAYHSDDSSSPPPKRQRMEAPAEPQVLTPEQFTSVLLATATCLLIAPLMDCFTDKCISRLILADLNPLLAQQASYRNHGHKTIPPALADYLGRENPNEIFKILRQLPPEAFRHLQSNLTGDSLYKFFTDILLQRAKQYLDQSKHSELLLTHQQVVANLDLLVQLWMFITNAFFDEIKKKRTWLYTALFSPENCTLRLAPYEPFGRYSEKQLFLAPDIFNNFPSLKIFTERSYGNFMRALDAFTERGQPLSSLRAPTPRNVFYQLVNPGPARPYTPAEIAMTAELGQSLAMMPVQNFAAPVPTAAAALPRSGPPAQAMSDYGQQVLEMLGLPPAFTVGQIPDDSDSFFAAICQYIHYVFGLRWDILFLRGTCAGQYTKEEKNPNSSIFNSIQPFITPQMNYPEYLLSPNKPGGSIDVEGRLILKYIENLPSGSPLHRLKNICFITKYHENLGLNKRLLEASGEIRDSTYQPSMNFYDTLTLATLNVSSKHYVPVLPSQKLFIQPVARRAPPPAAAMPSANAAAPADSEVIALQAEITRLQARIGTLQDALQKREQAYAQLRATLDAANEKSAQSTGAVQIKQEEMVGAAEQRVVSAQQLRVGAKEIVCPVGLAKLQDPLVYLCHSPECQGTAYTIDASSRAWYKQCYICRKPVPNNMVGRNIAMRQVLDLLGTPPPQPGASQPVIHIS